MTDRPINFSPGEILALREGRKTQKRFAISPEPPAAFRGPGFWTKTRIVAGIMEPGREVFGLWSDDEWAVELPMPGDRFWIREPFRCISKGPDEMRGLVYAADEFAEVALVDTKRPEDPDVAPLVDIGAGRMPRWASRFTLHVEAVRVGRLHDMTEDDALAEGVRRLPGGWFAIDADAAAAGASARAAFALFWDRRRANAPWNENPWTGILEVRARLSNIDAKEAKAA